MKSYNVTSHVHNSSNLSHLDTKDDTSLGNSVVQVREKHPAQGSKLNWVFTFFNKKKEAESNVELTKCEIKNHPEPYPTDFKQLTDAVFSNSKRKNCHGRLRNWHFGVTPAAFGPTPNEVAVRILEKVSSQHHYCQDGVIEVKHSRLKAGIAVNHADKTLAIIFKRKNDSGFQNLFKRKNSQQDYLNASVLINSLMSYTRKELNTYQVVIVGQSSDSKLVLYAASKNESANDKLKTVIV
ncbi:TPA: hypothetical protein ACGF2E_003318 [Vibrio cholerae]|uniref:hypothetical protein n=1 Tax=Vibrio cholerae TaxID=666 RepID=UPI0028621330|nr:hypothetical protein [Vibrio cholerae]EGR0597669.1 hypothetical protein [Vibrio cholerae]EGR1111132.1 hypothetical protein [Vibrio cholerae]EGR1837168.1 hypothetical protein [Vibrio cholerae]EGR2080831.1 hypothetical protein [Vibrio cholerae]EGR4106972.1 hypothetical protein [Vibrio cholerae]